METAQDTWEIPGFQVQQKIGEGGTGQVFRATQLSLQRTVAIKILNPSLHGHSPLLAFNRESQLMASLAHPNIVAVHDCGQVNGQFYLVMEHVAGRSLREEMIEGQPWPAVRAAKVLKAVAQALACIHSRGILHLDLKPENVLCTPDGTVKVTDFGLAIPQVDAQNISDLTWVQGSVDYCSPEQRHGLPQDQRSDVFSLAVLAYEILTGRVPGRFYVPASQRNPRLPAAIDDVLERGLARDPQERYSSVEEFGRDLDRILNPPLRRVSAWAAVAALGLALGGPAYLFWNHALKTAATPVSVKRAPVQGWLVYRNPDAAWGFEFEDEKIPTEVGGTPLTQISLHNLPPGTKLDPQVPDWPYPLPALVLAAPGRWCFYHPLDREAFGPEVTTDWTKLFDIPPLTSQENFIRAGHFEGDCLGGETAIWRKGGSQLDKEAPPICTLGIPDDRQDNQALGLFKSVSNAGQEMVCYQWLAREPRRPGTTMILRYRSRAEQGNASVAIGVIQPLFIPKADKSALANRLRELKGESAPPQPNSDADYIEYWVNDWITPTREWQTYCVVWQWPPYCANSSRNVVIQFGGEGKVWLDNVELFTWDREIAR
jgi:serine/threonine protein kinase